MMSYEQARDTLIAQLRYDATMHEAERHDEIGRRFDRIEHEFPPGAEPGLDRLRVAMAFWDGWIHARNHGWNVGGTIAPGEWPALARSVASDLEEERDVADPRVRARFDVSGKHGIGERAQMLSSRLRSG